MGEVSWACYLDYIRINGGVLFVVSILLLMTLGTLAQLYSNVAVVYWCEQPGSGHYLLLYALSSISIGLLYSGRAAILVASTLRQGRLLFQRMVRGLLDSPLRWWHAVPSGRVLNRLTQDINFVD